MIRIVFVLLSIFCSLQQAQATRRCDVSNADIVVRIRCLPGVDEVKEISSGKELRHFEIQFLQKVDHNDSSRGLFRQKLALLHRSLNEPMVLQTSGYMIFRVAETAIARIFQTNQLQIEHRHFATSTPGDGSWDTLNVEQSSRDFHTIVTSFKKLYSKTWVGTGASKGGMTSTYHRFFYPNDVSGTVADVAPMSFSQSDQRYNRFLHMVGGNKYKQCRQRLANLQAHLLRHSNRFLPFVKGQFNFLKGAKVAYEHAVIEMPFYFWQYGGPEHARKGCDRIPDLKNDTAVFHYLNLHSRLAGYQDQNLQAVMPYFYQAATELGSPDNITEHLEVFRNFEFTLNMYTPKVSNNGYSNQTMKSVSDWIKTDADRILFIYGAYDPWSAGEYDIGNNTKVKKYFVPKGNHMVNFTKLPVPERENAITLISRWLKKSPVVPQLLDLDEADLPKTLHQFEFDEKRKRGIL